MTEGKIWKEITKFAIPLFLGNLFQQFYNVVDSLVVGNVLGKEALAAVTSSGSLIFLLVGFVQGLFMGGSVIISRYIGARDDAKVSTAVHTMIAFSFLAGVVLTVVGVFVTPVLLRLMGTPEDVMPNSVIYFRVYFYGAIGVAMYNSTSSIFRAVGDSKHPLYYLIVSAGLNVVLDILFVSVFRFGIAGAAFATCISQFVSAIISFVKLTRIEGPARLKVREIRLERAMLKAMVRLGFPAGVQNSVSP